MAVPVVGAIRWWNDSDDAGRDVARACAVGGVFLIVLLVTLEVAGTTSPQQKRKRFGYFEVVLGADGRFSTSKSMVAAWTLVLATALVFLSAMVWFSDLTPAKAFGQEWNSYFLLLGGPFAAAVAAKGITASKAENGGKTSSESASSVGVATVPPTTTDEPTLGDISRNDAGGLSLTDTQYWIFSLVAIMYFLGAFVVTIVEYAEKAESTLALPEIPSAILGLTSLAALTYVGAKAVATEGLRIASITPHPTKATDKLTISVVNMPASVTWNQIYVRFSGPSAVPLDRPPTQDVVRRGGATELVVAPVPTGEYTVVVVTPHGVSGPDTLTVE
ncbi:hypothetical protein HP550_20425 [Cellulomonas humilata]|uniref:Uncharacterized protein n=1 Tax=Cellulomonas humilata TaxID=144055 RepID=A0A7Y6A4H8_9CELL|nr:hypothetical protein [Cellulomonas humilata]NUU19616.1 hypothetical protein [Cellulomonas humilata]